jgi:hypothetical protein
MPKVKTEKFSFRAECLADVALFITATVEHGQPGSLMNFRCNTADFGEVLGEFDSTMSLEDLRGVLREIEDSHVLMQTLRQLPLAQNSGERDFNVS